MVLKIIRRLLIVPALLLASGCGDPTSFSADPNPAKSKVDKNREKNRDNYWKGLAEPHDTFEAYVKALKKNKHPQAVSYIFMKNREQTEPYVIESMQDLSKTIRDEDWQIKIVRAAKEGRFAAIIFTTTTERDDPSPVLLIKDENRWHLHYFKHSGHLRNILDDETELAQALQLVDWGKRNVRELKNAAKQPQ